MAIEKRMCAFHPGRLAIGVCVETKVPICGECSTRSPFKKLTIGAKCTPFARSSRCWFRNGLPAPRKWDEWLAADAPIQSSYRESPEPLYAHPDGDVSDENPPIRSNAARRKKVPCCPTVQIPPA